jgi:hypothetical protein
MEGVIGSIPMSYRNQRTASGSRDGAGDAELLQFLWQHHRNDFPVRILLLFGYRSSVDVERRSATRVSQ